MEPHAGQRREPKPETNGQGARASGVQVLHPMSDRRAPVEATAPEDDEPRERHVKLRLALGMCAFGSATPVSKIVTAAMPVFIGSAARILLGALVLAPLARRRTGTPLRRLTRADWTRIGAIALFGMFGFSALMLIGMRMISGVAGAIVMSTTPAVTAAASMLFLGDRPTWRKITAVVLAVAGVLILQITASGSDSGESNLALGALLVFGAVCCEAVYTLVGKQAAKRIEPVRVAFLSAIVSLPLFAPFVILEWDAFTPGAVDLRAWLALAWYGAGTLALGTWLWYSGLEKAEGAVAAGFMGLMPASALVLSYVLLGEPFEALHLLGFAVVLSGVLLISREHARHSGDS